MDYFNKNTYVKLEKVFTTDKRFTLIILYGAYGSGKTHIIHEVLNKFKIVTQDIIFSNERFFPFGLLTDEEWLINDENTILSFCSEILQREQCLFLQNMEYCNLDYENLFYRLFRFYQNTNSKMVAILEYNTNTFPADKICHLANEVIKNSIEDPNIFRNYLKEKFLPAPTNEYLFEKIVQLSSGNIHAFYSVLNILQHLEVIHKNCNGNFEYRDTCFKIPNDILALQVILLERLEQYYKEPLQCAAPFSYYIYEKVLKDIFHQFDNVDKYLSILSQYESVIKNNDIMYPNSELFHSSYTFSSPFAQDAVLTQLNNDETDKKIAEYYRYFDKIYHNREIYNSLKEADKVLLLCYLTKNRKNSIDINQIKYFIELMAFYYEHFMYNNVIELANKLLNSKVLNISQLNKEAHCFWIIYFNSLLSIGDYECVIKYKNEFMDDDLNYLIARAVYYNGNPEDALNILKDIIKAGNDVNSINIGYKYSLMASIYDWLGDNKKSEKYFRCALLYCDLDENLKFQLYKKYSQHVDFRIEECRNKMLAAIDFYKKSDLKQYAECLHNFGTGCIFISDYDIAEKSLTSSLNLLNKICSNEIYYPLNSLGILYCYDGSRYDKAIQLWEDALKSDINELFCELALHNNIFNIYIKMNEYEKAQKQKEYIEKRIQEMTISENIFKDSKLNIQHQLRQFYYNCAIFSKSTDNLKDALQNFIKARESSTYHSTMIYSIEKNIDEIEYNLHRKRKRIKFNVIKKPKPTSIEKSIYENEMYLCEIMYWG